MGATRAAACVPEVTTEWIALERIIKLQLRRWVVDEDDLNDMTQECLGKVWLKGGTFRGTSTDASSSCATSTITHPRISAVSSTSRHRRFGAGSRECVVEGQLWRLERER